MIVKTGNTFSIGNNSSEYFEKLPLGTYQLRQVPMTENYYLEKVSDFKLPSKLYGDFSVIDRWKKGYEQAKCDGKNLGILLTGIKGAGKTLTAKKLCLELNQPVILLSESFSGPGFINFMTSKELGHCTIFIDEFEKRFSNNDRSADVTSLFSLLDGVSATSHLYLMTINDVEAMNQYLMNRPSRIHFRKDYESLEESVIRDVASDKGMEQDMIDNLIDTCSELDEVSFDSVISIINDSILYKELPSESVKHMNFTLSEYRADIKVYVPEDLAKFSKSVDSLYINKHGIASFFDQEILQSSFYIHVPTLQSDEDYARDMIDHLECTISQKDDEDDSTYNERIRKEAQKYVNTRYKLSTEASVSSNFDRETLFNNGQRFSLPKIRKYYNKEKKIYIIPPTDNGIGKTVYIEIKRCKKDSVKRTLSVF